MRICHDYGERVWIYPRLSLSKIVWHAFTRTKRLPAASTPKSEQPGCSCTMNTSLLSLLQLTTLQLVLAQRSTKHPGSKWRLISIQLVQSLGTNHLNLKKNDHLTESEVGFLRQNVFVPLAPNIYISCFLFQKWSWNISRQHVQNLDLGEMWPAKGAGTLCQSSWMNMSNMSFVLRKRKEHPDSKNIKYCIQLGNL